MIRSWTLYIVRFEGGYYYVTTTALKISLDLSTSMAGPPAPALIKSKAKEIVEVRPLGICRIESRVY